ncbi:MAG: hypothetical protein WCE79_20830 [Xanthobacteraceae bacterium]
MLRTFQIDPEPAQQLLPTGASMRFEGLGYSSSGAVLGAATADTHEALLFRRGADGRFASAPFCTLAGLQYPHDISFENSGSEILAVAQRAGAVALFEPAGETYGPAPSFEIAGPDTKLEFTDAVAFVPGSDHLAACNLSLGTVSFYRVLSRKPVRIETAPCYELKHPAMDHPDGIAFSNDGAWLASANHGSHSVTIFRRGANAGDPIYGPYPVADIRDDDLRYPHSVAFTDNGHLIMTNAGANYMKVYRFTAGRTARDLSVAPVFKMAVNEEATFHEVNNRNKMEGGPKGLAVHGNEIAVCSPEIGIKIYRFREETLLDRLKRFIVGSSAATH